MESHFPSIEELDPSLGDLLSTTDTADSSAFPDLLNPEDAGNNETSEFERSFPALDDDQNPAGVMGSTLPYMPTFAASANPTPQPPAHADDEEEPEVIREWRERTALRIAHQDEQSERKKRENIEKARHAIDDFYENYNLKKDKSIAQTRKEEEEFLANRENPSVGGTTWERIAKLVDLSDKSARSGKSDKTRFRELLLSLKKDENAPGSKVVVE